MSSPVELNLPFRPRARLLQLLGDQLIGTPRLAVFELVKNAYDADAELVTVVLKDSGIDSARIVVRDDGDGMTLDTIRDIWLVPAHDHRELQRIAKKRTALNRLPLGEKGVGRFAVHKLGDRVEVVTRAKGELECIVSIDWAAEIEKQFLSDTAVSIKTREPVVFTDDKTGTIITISKLRESEWSRGDVRRLLRQITSISSPFNRPADRFKAVLEVPDHPDWVAGVPDTTSILNRAPWHFLFTFDKGVLEWTYEFRGVTGIRIESHSITKTAQPLLIAPVRDEDGLVRNNQSGKSPRRTAVADAGMSEGIGPVIGEFFVFDRDRLILNKLGDSQLLSRFLDENGGVRVYRDGIRVYNYGEPGDDWLGLDLRRVNTPTRNISRNIIVGALDLSLEQSYALKEKTNREGFVEAEAYLRLKQIVLGALSILETERKLDKQKIRALTDTGKDPEIEKIAKPLEALRQVADKHKLTSELGPLIDKVERDYNDMRDTMLRAGLSGMGLAVIFHEIEQGVRILSNAIDAGEKPETVQSQARELVRILDGFTDLLRKGDRKPNSLKHLLKRARDISNVRFRSHNVRLVCPAVEESAPDYLPSFAFSLALGAVNNILDNAFYWLDVRWPDETRPESPVPSPSPTRRAIYMNIDPDFAEGPAVIIADTGPGFQDEPDTLRRPFFSRRPEGMGMGLYYVNLVMELNGGRLVFPDRDEAGVPEEFDGAVLALVFSPTEKP